MHYCTKSAVFNISEEKILNVLENNPSGLSISEIAKRAGLHRNTVSMIIKKLIEKEEIEEKKIGVAKVYYLKKYAGLHKTEMGYEGKNIKIGIGVSDLSDGYKAAISAAKQAVMQSSKGGEPTFSLVFVSSRYNDQIEKVVKGINQILGTNWVGCTTDSELNSLTGFSQNTIEVLCIDSKYLHFSVGVAENYREDPFRKAKEATEEAINKSIIDRSIFSTTQFMRSTKKSFTDIIRNPPYFILTFIGGFYFDNGKPVPGMEYEFLEGIKNTLGPFIPIIGASSISDTQKFLEGKGENYQFANGKIYKTAAIVCFIISELYFSYGLEHGYVPTDKVGRITKVSGNGRIIEEINGKPAVDEYCRMTNIDKNDFLKKSMMYTTFSPISILYSDVDICPLAAGANPDKKSLFIFSKVFQNSIINISKYDEEKSLKAIANAISQAKEGHENKNIAFGLIFSCAGRKNALGEKVTTAIENIKNIHGEFPFFGFYSNGEIGARKNNPPRYNNFTVTTLIIFDKLQIE